MSDEIQDLINSMLFDEFGFEDHFQVDTYFFSQTYKKDGYDIDCVAGDLQKAIQLLCRSYELNQRALAIINNAILHGMPVTEEVAAVSNAIRGTANDS